MSSQRTVSDHPLSAAQLRWWVAQQLYPAIPNTVAMYLDLRGPLDVALMRGCGCRAARELGTPGVQVRSVDGRPRQVRTDAELAFTDCDLAAHHDPVTRALDRMDDDYHTPLDPRTDVLTVAVLYRVAPQRHLLYLRSHHLALDGAGAVALLRRTGELYRAAVTGTDEGGPGGLDTAGLLAAENAYRCSARAVADRDYWGSVLAGLAEPVGLAGRPAAPRARPHRVSAVVGPATARSVATARRRHGASFGELLIAALGSYVARLTGNDDPVLSLPVPARTTAVLRRSAGSVANVVPLRLTGIARGTVGAAVSGVRAKVLGALRHQQYSYEDIQRDRGGGRVERGGFGPVINVLGFVEPLRLGPVTGHAHLLSSGPVEDLLVNGYQLGPEESSIRIDFQGNPARYSPATLAWFHSGFLAFLDRFLVAAADEPVARIDISENLSGEPGSDAPRPELRRDPRTRGQPSVRLLPELLRAGMRSPDSVAVGDGTRSLTYLQLDHLSRRWARVLAEYGAGPGVSVAVVVPRSIESVLGLWAVATVGACFVPIDPTDPPHRIAAVLAAAGIRLGLTVTAVRPELLGVDTAPAGTDDVADRVRWLELDGAAGAARTPEKPAATGSTRHGGNGKQPGTYTDTGGPEVPWSGLCPDHPAYLIHTSGTTGTPKGVLVGHRGLGPLTEYIVDRYRVGADSVVLHAHSPAFDAHLLELLAAFAAGARLFVAPAGPPVSGELTDTIRAAEITHLLSTPAVLGTLDPGRLPSLQAVVTGGEAPAAELVRRWVPRVRLYNGYGPTEATVMTMQSEPLTPDEPVLIGPALPGVRAAVLDTRLRPVPTGGRGELYVGGPGVALGYLHNPAATAARFVADPAGTDARLYRTGDLVRADPGGYEFLGRVDRQLALHGRRIEPGEIESALTACAEITQAVVTVAGGPGPSARLAGYVVVAAGHRFDPAGTLRRLRTVLPAALVPAVLLEIDRIPLTPNGKLDRDRLPEPVSARSYRAPETEIQRLVAQKVGSIVGRPDIGVDDDFFALGGNSLLGVGLAAELADATDVPVTVRWLYTTPTVADLADRIASYRGTDSFEARNGQVKTESGIVATADTEGLQTLLPLRCAGASPPLFCFHSAVPLAWCYMGLSRRIGDRPVYGIQSPVLTSDEPDPATVETLADRYLCEILRAQPEGPYHLLGWSLGGQLAHAVGVRLRDLGREVAVLALLDSVVFPPDTPPPPRPRMRDLLTHLLGGEPDEADAAQIPDLTAAEAAAELAAAGATLGAGLSADRLDRLHRAYIAGVEISARYRPGVFDGDLLYFSATRGMTELLDARLWRPYVTGDLIEFSVDAAHGQLMNPEAVAVIAPILTDHLAGLAEPVDSR
ncbi:amino acid adenylation domain-containing protein [Nocardia carnea]|uniref:amino acid adenylation domain-containing protein n=1 Tax=Nocardia carnea TaxID=37328 RepID=UPI002457474F|nr:amino acid adenylation domain-containing protein [Nocardia carnea]